MHIHHTQNHSAHGHTHEKLENAGHYDTRPRRLSHRDYEERAFTVGIGGPVGSGKTALVLALCQRLRNSIPLCVVTNDIFTREDCEFLLRHEALDPTRVEAVETGGCPHAAIREDITANLQALERLSATHRPQMLLIESGGDNLAADFSRELADFTIYVIDVAGGDKIPRKGGPGMTQSDFLVINKTDLAQAVGADLSIMERDAASIRGDGPWCFAQVKFGQGVNFIVESVLKALDESKSVPGSSSPPV